MTRKESKAAMRKIKVGFLLLSARDSAIVIRRPLIAIHHPTIHPSRFHK